MEFKLRYLLALFLTLCNFQLSAQTTIATSFESPEYTAGNVTGKNNWTVTAGTAEINSAKFHTGSQSLNFKANATNLVVNYTAYNGNTQGITGDVYADFWVNPGSLVTRGIAINGIDQWSSSIKRIFVVEFATDGKIKGYNGSSAVNITNWTTNTWTRVSLKIDFVSEKYQIAIDGTVFATQFSFRETYTPAASGTRPANVKEFHSLLFNHLADVNTATTDLSIDDLYIGKTAIADVSFGASSNVRTITVTQPTFGTISLSPAAPYIENQTVTATLNLPQGYINNGWTGALSGTENIKTFVVTGNLSIGANVGIDNSNPPPKYTVNIQQPTNGTITLSPVSSDNQYYKETSVTATITYEPCFQFDGWTGNLSGTQLTQTFKILTDVSIGANISLNSTTAVTRVVNSVANFKTALAAMNPGDIIEVEDGTYNLSSLTVTRSGCSNQPILITAKNKGKVILNGATALVLRNMNYVTIKGFVFRSASIGTGIKLENCTHLRITENDFSYTETSSCTWIYIGDTYASPLPLKSGYNRIDHNKFEGKTQAGNYIRLDGNINQQTQYDTIDFNHFKNNGPRADNEKESIRVGVSTLSKSSGFTIIQYNLFEDCDGDPEIVSIKSCDNIIRYNTFVRSLGTLCLRQGFRSTVEGNYFFGDNKTGEFNGGIIGAGGIRVYGKDHKIINNYFSELTGSKWDAAITITNGDVNNNSSSLADHYLPENILVSNNTFVNNQSDIEIGFNNNGKYPLSPINCTITNNIVLQNTNPIVKSYSTASLNGVNFNNNIFYPTGTSSVGITTNASQVTVVDPQLTQPICISPTDCVNTNSSKVLRLSANSPAINASSGNYNFITKDNELQNRVGPNDMGADEYQSANPITINFSALDSLHVGPNAIPFTYTYQQAGVLPLNILSFKANKFQGITKISWAVTGEELEHLYELEWSNDGINFIKIREVAANKNPAIQQYNIEDAKHLSGTNYYRLKIININGKYKYSAITSINYAVSISIFPNPAQEKLTIQLGVEMRTDLNVHLYSIEGKLVKKSKTKQYKLLLNIQDLPNGIYILKLSNQKVLVQQQKIIIQK